MINELLIKTSYLVHLSIYKYYKLFKINID